MSGWVGDIVGGGVAGTQIAAQPSRTAAPVRASPVPVRPEAGSQPPAAAGRESRILRCRACGPGPRHREFRGSKYPLHSQRPPKLAAGHAGEDQLPVVAQQIERASAFIGVVSAQRVPTLAVQEFGLGPGHRGGILFAPLDYPEVRLPGLRWLCRRTRRNRPELVWSALWDRPSEQPILGFHEMAVGVVVNSTLGIGHGDTTSGSSRRCCGVAAGLFSD